MSHDWYKNIEMGHSKSEYECNDEPDDIISVLEDLADSWEPEDGFPFAVLLDRIESGKVSGVTRKNMMEEIESIREEFGRNKYYKGDGNLERYYRRS
jgi:hypothetical protein